MIISTRSIRPVLQGIEVQEGLKKRSICFFSLTKKLSLLEPGFENQVSTQDNQQDCSICTFHTSQIWNFNQQTATYNEVQNPDILEFLGPQELLNALHRYYSEWPLQLSVLTGGTQQYRDFSRSVTPMEMQKYMWDACYDISVLDVQDFVPCSAPPLDTDIIDEVYEAILRDPTFKGILTRRLSTLYTRNIVYENILQED